MRLDKFLSVMATATRSESAKAARQGRVTVNGIAVRRADAQIDPERDEISFDGRRIFYRKYCYLLIHKPDGVVSATEDGRDRTVLDLLPPEYQTRGLFPCGRLDKHTTGLMLLTDDGDLAHRLLSPRRHVKKTYRFRVKFPLTEEECARFEGGLVLEDGYETKPAKIRLETPTAGEIVLIEGKYHQIKRMMLALHNQITELSRVTFGPLVLPEDLEAGAWRALTPEEEAAILTAAGRTSENEGFRKEF